MGQHLLRHVIPDVGAKGDVLKIRQVVIGDDLAILVAHRVKVRVTHPEGLLERLDQGGIHLPQPSIALGRVLDPGIEPLPAVCLPHVGLKQRGPGGLHVGRELAPCRFIHQRGQPLGRDHDLFAQRAQDLFLSLYAKEKYTSLA